MTHFEDAYFQKIDLDDSEVRRFLENAWEDFRIAETAVVPKVTFKMSYDALIKAGIAVTASRGYKVRSVAGHHVKILEKLSEILKDEDIAVFGNRMRQMRNLDFYEGGVEITEKDSKEYLAFIRSAIQKAEGEIKRR